MRYDRLVLFPEIRKITKDGKTSSVTVATSFKNLGIYPMEEVPDEFLPYGLLSVDKKIDYYGKIRTRNLIYDDGMTQLGKLDPSIVGDSIEIPLYNFLSPHV
jgi:hypothetical protein